MAFTSKLFAHYEPNVFFDETFGLDKTVRPQYEEIIKTFEAYGDSEFQRRRATRLRIFELIAEGEKTVSEIVDEFSFTLLSLSI